MKHNHLLVISLFLSISSSSYALDILWQASSPVASPSGQTSAYCGSDGSAAVRHSGQIYWYSKSGTLQETIDLVASFGTAAGGSYDIPYITENSLIITDNDWNGSGRLIVLSLANGVLTNQVIVCIPPNQEAPHLSNYIPAINGSFLTMYKLPNSGTSGAISLTPTNSVVIPSSFTGNFNVKVESSTDLVEWTQTSTGTFNSDTSDRFFRLKVETAE